MPSDYVPLSVREGDWRKKTVWWLKEQRQRLALWLAPWLRSLATETPPKRSSCCHVVPQYVPEWQQCVHCLGSGWYRERVCSDCGGKGLTRTVAWEMQMKYGPLSAAGTAHDSAHDKPETL